MAVDSKRQPIVSSNHSLFFLLHYVNDDHFSTAGPYKRLWVLVVEWPSKLQSPLDSRRQLAVTKAKFFPYNIFYCCWSESATCIIMEAHIMKNFTFSSCVNPPLGEKWCNMQHSLRSGGGGTVIQRGTNYSFLCNQAPVRPTTMCYFKPILAQT